MSEVLLNATFRPIHRWPGPETRDRRPSRFRASWKNTIDLLHRELRMLGARHVVLQMDLTERQLRLDGYPRAGARPDTPRVILSFETSDGVALSFPCDTWTDWQDNLRAIALTLEHLRAVERYGVTRRQEQYAGWRALPAGGSTSATFTSEAAAEFVARAASNGGAAISPQQILADHEHCRAAYRQAAKRLHPDGGAGSHELFQRLQVARAVLEAHHGGRS